MFAVAVAVAVVLCTAGLRPAPLTLPLTLPLPVTLPLTLDLELANRGKFKNAGRRPAVQETTPRFTSRGSLRPISSFSALPWRDSPQCIRRFDGIPLRCGRDDHNTRAARMILCGQATDSPPERSTISTIEPHRRVSNSQEFEIARERDSASRTMRTSGIAFAQSVEALLKRRPRSPVVLGSNFRCPRLICLESFRSEDLRAFSAQVAKAAGPFCSLLQRCPAFRIRIRARRSVVGNRRAGR